MGIETSVQVQETSVEIFQYRREDGIIGWMDCGGSNLVKINEQIPGIVKMIATTKVHHTDCKARQRAAELKVPLADQVNFQKYEEGHGVYPGDYFKALQILELEDLLAEHGGMEPGIDVDRTAYEIDGLRKKLKSKKHPEEIDYIRRKACDLFEKAIDQIIDEQGLSIMMPVFAAGGMALLSSQFVANFFILNVHPGDLTKYHTDAFLRKKRMVVGDAWKPSAIALSAGHEILYSSLHQMIPAMDAGPVFMRGYGLPIDYNYLLSSVDIQNKDTLKAVGEAAQETLKHIGDHVIAGATFQDLFDGKWGMHESGVLAYQFRNSWYLAPNGIMIEDHIANNPRTVFQREQSFIDQKVNGFYDQIKQLKEQKG